MSQERNEQMQYLPDGDLVDIFCACKSELRRRRISEHAKAAFRQINHKRKYERTNNHDSLLRFERGAVRRTPKESILIDFLREDWTPLFSTYDNQENTFYVYYHTDKTQASMRFRRYGETVLFQGRPFYVGKGKGNRAYDSRRSPAHRRRINILKEQGFGMDEIAFIFQDGLTERQAMALEAKLITFFGCKSEIHRHSTHFHGIKGGLLLNNEPSVRPDDVDRMIDMEYK